MISGLFFVAKILDELIITQSNKIVNIIILSSKKEGYIMSLFERTKDMASKRKMSLQEVATKAGLGINSIYGWKTKKPSYDRIEKVADVLNVTTDYLLGNSIRMHDTESNTVDLAAEGVFLYQGQEVTDEQMEIIRSMMESWQD